MILPYPNHYTYEVPTGFFGLTAKLGSIFTMGSDNVQELLDKVNSLDTGWWLWNQNTYLLKEDNLDPFKDVSRIVNIYFASARDAMLVKLAIEGLEKMESDNS